MNVSIINWIKDPIQPPSEYVLDGVNVTSISPSLRSGELDVGTAKQLEQNAGRSFQGPNPAGAGFVLSQGAAQELLNRSDSDYSKVIRPYLVAEDITEEPHQAPRRWIIDFGQMSLEEAQEYPSALDIVREKVKPARDKVRRKSRRERWWRFGEVAVGMRRAVVELDRFIVGTRVSKRLLFAWCRAPTCPADATNVFAFSNDYSMGILCSAQHDAWGLGQLTMRRFPSHADLGFRDFSVAESVGEPKTRDRQSL